MNPLQWNDRRKGKKERAAVHAAAKAHAKDFPASTRKEAYKYAAEEVDKKGK